jgi:hypothetical protein
MAYDIAFNFRRLKADIKLEVPELPDLFQKHFGIELTRNGIYAWFERGSMPLERLMQLLTIVMMESDKKVRLNVWDYIEATEKGSRKRKKVA